MTVAERPSPDRRVLSPDGTILDGNTVEDIDDETMLAIYRDMRLMRRFDERAVSWQRQGRIGTYPSLAGQEGAQVASAHALAEPDWIFPTYRDKAACHVRGMPLEVMLLDLLGHPDGNAVPEDCNVFTQSIPIATQLPHAVGMAMAADKRDERAAFLAYFGDGATSEGDFHEAMNFAGVFDAPVVFFCNNNQYAISVPLERQTASDSIAIKAQAYGFEGVTVDGMDPLAVYRITRWAREKAVDPIAGQPRPTLIEAEQYRYNDHTTADDASRYRDEEEVEAWRERDPIGRLERFLLETGRLDGEYLDALAVEIDAYLEEVIEAAEAESVDISMISEHTYDTPPEQLRRQFEER